MEGELGKIPVNLADNMDGLGKIRANSNGMDVS